VAQRLEERAGPAVFAFDQVGEQMIRTGPVLLVTERGRVDRQPVDEREQPPRPGRLDLVAEIAAVEPFEVGLDQAPAVG
jgi:hypothetical protein